MVRSCTLERKPDGFPASTVVTIGCEKEFFRRKFCWVIRSEKVFFISSRYQQKEHIILYICNSFVEFGFCAPYHSHDVSSRQTAVASEYALRLRELFSLVLECVESAVMGLEAVDVGSIISLERWLRGVQTSQ
jgi:hypothetical protein